MYDCISDLNSSFHSDLFQYVLPQDHGNGCNSESFFNFKKLYKNFQHLRLKNNK